MTTETATVQALRSPAEAQMPAVSPGFGSLQSFELMQRAARLLSSSDLVPEQYRATIEKRDKYGNITDTRENPKALANCVVALNMSERMRADPLMIMQNLHIIEGRPSWSAPFIIAMINNCGRFSPLRFDIRDRGEREIEYTTFDWKTDDRGKRYRETVVSKAVIRDRSCIAWVIERETGERLESDEISIELAVKEGWYTKNGSKWQTMPGQMLRYRAGAFFGRIYAPELLMGLPSDQEVYDTLEARPTSDGTITVDVDQLRAQAAETAATDRTQAKPKHPDATDLDSREPAPPSSSAAAKSQSKATESTADDLFAADTSTASNQQAPLHHDDPPLTESIKPAQVEAQLRTAKDIEVLDLAADFIGDVSSEAEKERLTALYQQLRLSMTNVQQRTRRTRVVAPE